MLLILVFLLIGLIFYLTQRRPTNFPPGPQWYPLFGNSIQLRKTARKLGGTQKVYDKWAKEFNSPDVVGFRLGGQLFVVGLSAEAVSDIHNKPAFQGRPHNLFAKLRSFNNNEGGILMADGNLWKEHRFFAQKNLKNLGYGGTKMYEAIEVELEKFKEIIDKQMSEHTSFWPGQYLSAFVMNVLWAIVAGDQDTNNIKSRDLFNLLDTRAKAFDFSGGLLSDFPWLRHILPEFSGYNLILQFNDKLQTVLRGIIRDHHKNYTADRANDDFVYTFMTEMKKQEGNKDSTFTDLQLMIIMVDFFLGGAHTTSTNYDTILMTLALYPHIQDELYAQFMNVSKDNEDLLKISQHQKLPLFEAFLMECARFHSIIPISGPRRAMEDTVLCGYHIPKGTTVLIGLEQIHKDKTFWGDPEVFRPERFLNASKTQIINTDHFQPFGQGKRLCLGITLAKAFLHTFLVGIVKDYKLTVPRGEKPPNLNLIPGIIKTVHPYKITFTKRF